MNNEDIKMFIKAFKDFMQHASIEEKNYLDREKAKKYAESYYETKAKELEVTVDYYMAEFL